MQKADKHGASTVCETINTTAGFFYLLFVFFFPFFVTCYKAHKTQCVSLDTAKSRISNRYMCYCILHLLLL